MMHLTVLLLGLFYFSYVMFIIIKREIDEGKK